MGAGRTDQWSTRPAPAVFPASLGQALYIAEYPRKGTQMTISPRSKAAVESYAHTLLAQRIQRYHRNRDRPRQTTKAPVPYSYHELDEIVHLAEVWLPFGGPPEEVIFVRFGIGTAEFEEKLQAALA